MRAFVQSKTWHGVPVVVRAVLTEHWKGGQFRKRTRLHRANERPDRRNRLGRCPVKNNVPNVQMKNEVERFLTANPIGVNGRPPIVLDLNAVQQALKSCSTLYELSIALRVHRNTITRMLKQDQMFANTVYSVISPRRPKGEKPQRNRNSSTYRQQQHFWHSAFVQRYREARTPRKPKYPALFKAERLDRPIRHGDSISRRTLLEKTDSYFPSPEEILEQQEAVRNIQQRLMQERGLSEIEALQVIKGLL